jgi:hypothetical protein
MAEILVGTNSPVYHQVYWEGEAVASDALPTVKVYDITVDPGIIPAISPSTLLATITSSLDEVNVGMYKMSLPLSLTNRNRSLKFLWEYTVNGNFVSKNQYVSVITPYTDFSHACGCLGISTDPSDPNFKSYRELQAAERYARKRIESYTNQKFYLYDDRFTVYGSGSDILPLPEKLSDLHELYVNDYLLLDNISEINNWGLTVEIADSGFGIRINRMDSLDNTVYVANGMVPPTIHDSQGIFKAGVPYRVAGRYGWSSVPDEVDSACIELMKDFFSKDSVWTNKYIKSIQTFDWKFDYTSDATSGTGNAYADKLLDSYVVTQMVII